ncbi:MAG: hypothetical protein R3288_10115 [Woeseiaceae bacterium]|nr:hypothetical protein [Woeseiaceae bacterium]
MLLTLLSIIQALALEFLWTHVRDSDYLFEPNWRTFLHWAQITATFLVIVQIWIVYVSNALRFRWVPRTSDSIYPFLIGVLEFALVELHDPGLLGWWFVCLAALFGLVTWVDHSLMRQARRDGENDWFFSRYKPATLRDFYPSFAIFFAVIGAGIVCMVIGEDGVPAFLALLGANLMGGFFIRQSTMYWNESIAERLHQNN